MNPLILLFKYALCRRIDMIYYNFLKLQYNNKIRLIYKEGIKNQKLF